MQSKNVFTKGKFVAFIATLCCLLWGSAFPAVKNGYILFKINSTDIPSKFVFAGYRFTLSGILLLVIAMLFGENIFKISKKSFVQLVLLGLIQTTLQYIFFYIGLSNASGVKSSIMTSTAVFFSVILAHFIYKNDKLNKKKIIGCLLGFVGVMIANFSFDLFNFSFTVMGEGFMVISALASSVAGIYSKRITRKENVIVVTAYSLFIGGVMLIILGRVYGGRLTNFTPVSSILLIYLAFLSSAAFCLWNLLLKYNKVGAVSIYNFLVPIFGVILSSIFLNETIFEMKNIGALLLVCLGIWIVNKEKVKS